MIKQLFAFLAVSGILASNDLHADENPFATIVDFRTLPVDVELHRAEERQQSAKIVQVDGQPQYRVEWKQSIGPFLEFCFPRNYANTHTKLPAFTTARIKLRVLLPDRHSIHHLNLRLRDSENEIFQYACDVSKLPAGWLGLVAASLIAAYMSTIATHLNWGSSYLVQDFYVRFINPKAEPKKQVLMGRLFMLVLLVGCAVMALVLQSAKGGFDLMLQVGAGTGLIYILRWFWHRLNAWSEISAMIISFLVACFFQWGAPACGLEGGLQEGWRAEWFTLGAWKLILGVVITTMGWLAVTFATPAEPKETLDSFDKLIHADLRELPMGVVCMVFGCLAVWTCLFGCGYLIYAAGGAGCWCLGGALLVASVVSTVVLMKLVGRTKLS